ncbi:MAG: hypothetical protein V4548_08990 [Bacteroidota bacterium]
MIRQLLLLTMLALGLFSCKQTIKTEPKPTVVKVNQVKNVRFDFTAERINTFPEGIEIKGTLYNDSNEDVYFLTTSCDGTQHSLRYDTTKFSLQPLLCNSSYTIIMKIEPKGRYDFKTHLEGDIKENKIKLGFDFYSVDKYFDIRNKSQASLNIFNRPEGEQTIVWGDEKKIKSLSIK